MCIKAKSRKEKKIWEWFGKNDLHGVVFYSSNPSNTFFLVT